MQPPDLELDPDQAIGSFLDGAGNPLPTGVGISLSTLAETSRQYYEELAEGWAAAESEAKQMSTEELESRLEQPKLNLKKPTSYQHRH